MSAEETAALEELRCFICKGYLSCSPIRSLPNGNCICGRCSPLNARTPVHRLRAFESLLGKLSFPCIFKKNGCIAMLKYGKTADHESKCVYKSFICPMNNIASCVWSGTASQFADHFNEEHPDILKNDITFKLEVDKDAQNILIVTENSLAFILKYFYVAHEKLLKYNVKICSNKKGLEGFFQIQLMSGVDSDCVVNLKMDNCCSYDESFSEMQNAKVLNLNKFLECLNEPSCITVTMKLAVVKPDGTNVPYEDHHDTHSDLIKSLRCYICQNYLVPPLFHSNDQTICCHCAEKNPNYKQLDDAADLVERVNKAMYPCRWRDCNVLSKSDTFKNHDMHCQFRQYYCVYPQCNVTFKWSKAMDHLRQHTPNCVTDGVTYTTSLAQKYNGKDIITIKNNRIILIEHDVGQYDYFNFAHEICLRRVADDKAKVTGIVVLEHAHCKLKSKEFTINDSRQLRIALKDLPSCFKVHDQLSVTVDLIA